nr:PREDICTED: baculoviral IAP repeat-containing protein 5 [Megachile rotundata]
MDLLPELNSTFWRASRLKTFEDWPFQSIDEPCNPEQMASAGFVFIGNKEEPDLAECFICSKQLDGWNSDDDPWNEHLKHQPECPFIKLGKPDEASWTVQDLFNLFKKYIVKECNNELDRALTKAKEESSKLVGEIPYIYRELKRNIKS